MVRDEIHGVPLFAGVAPASAVRLVMVVEVRVRDPRNHMPVIVATQHLHAAHNEKT